MGRPMTLGRWRVERAGSEGHYLPGWIAYTGPDGIGASFSSWDEAFAFAYRRASVAIARAQAEGIASAARRGLWKASARPWKMTTTAACRAELHELCEPEWCVCSCHTEGEG